MSFPMASMLPDDVTGTISKVPFGGLLDAEDRRREQAALATALDPQGDGSAVHWDNVKSGHKGSLTAVGDAFTQESKVCRAFLADLDSSRTLQGIACTTAPGVWEMRGAKPFAKA